MTNYTLPQIDRIPETTSTPPKTFFFLLLFFLPSMIIFRFTSLSPVLFYYFLIFWDGNPIFLFPPSSTSYPFFYFYTFFLAIKSCFGYNAFISNIYYFSSFSQIYTFSKKNYFSLNVPGKIFLTKVFLPRKPSAANKK